MEYQFSIWAENGKEHANTLQLGYNKQLAKVFIR